MWMQTAATGKGTKSGCKYNSYRRRRLEKMADKLDVHILGSDMFRFITRKNK